ncbi:MAG: 3'(2'),5'-bisphosphate nucleotidase [Acidobacteria bacterium]|nr:MAG: 3'(2'),5'-bisphosphate nucleotidase [Acidobacteriota bacterium]
MENESHRQTGYELQSVAGIPFFPMNLDHLSPELDFALKFARQAADVAFQVERDMVLSTLTKDDRSPVTTADFAIQALAGRLIHEAFPGDILVAEESAAMIKDGKAPASLEEITKVLARIWPETTADKIFEWVDRGTGVPGDRFWTLDPIDGTKGFIRGDQYATALALVVKGEVQLGVLTCPRLAIERGKATVVRGNEGSVLIACRGQGAWSAPLKNGTAFAALAVSSAHDPSEAVVVRSYEDSHTNTDQLDRLVEALGIQSAPVRMDSQAKYAVVAAGAADLLLRFRSSNRQYDAAKIWDHAAGALIVQEAGGCVTDLHGKPLDFSAGRTLARNEGLLASNRHLHGAALAGLRAIAEDRG